MIQCPIQAMDLRIGHIPLLMIKHSDPRLYKKTFNASLEASWMRNEELVDSK